MASKKTAKKAPSTPSKDKAPAPKKDRAPTPITNSMKRISVSIEKLAGRPPCTLAQQQAKLRALSKKINEKYGNDDAPILTVVDDTSCNSYLRRPSGIMQLDLDTGGGLPAQSFNTIGGPPNAGKSSLLYHYYGMHQQIYGDAAFIFHGNTEGGVDYIQARRCGWIIAVPMNVIEAMQASRAEQHLPLLSAEEIAELRRSVGTNYIIEASTMEEILDITEELLRSNMYGIGGIDSYEGLMPKAEASLNSLEDFAQQAARANVITRFLQHYGVIKRNPAHYTTFLMTTQVRTNRNKANLPAPMQKYVKDYSDDKSAWALQHWRSLHILVDAGAKIKEGAKDAGTVIGKEFTWKIAKGKEGAHDNVHGSTPYYYDARAFNQLTTVVATAIKYGVVQEREGKLTFFRDAAGGGRVADDYLCQIAGKDNFVRAMAEEPDSEWALRKAICRAASVSEIFW